MKMHTLSLTALLLVGAVPASAEAKVVPASADAAPASADAEVKAAPSLLRPGTRAMWASLGVGPAAGLDKVNTQFKLTQTFGYHFSGAAAGPAVAFELQESFGQGVVTLELGPKFVWDIQLIDGVGFYLSPSAMAGFAHLTGGGSGISGFTVQLAVEGKLVLADRGMVFFRPVSVDILGLASGGLQVGARWDLLLGGGLFF